MSDIKRALLLFFAIFSVYAIGEDNSYIFKVDNTTMVDAYWNIFNAIVALMQSKIYSKVLALIFLIGGIITFYAGVVKSGEDGSHRGMYDFSKYLIGATLLLIILGIRDDGTIAHPSKLIIVPKKVDVYCSSFNDTNATSSSSSMGEATVTIGGLPTAGAVVGNVPGVLGWGFSFFNTIGTEMERMARTAFSGVGGGSSDIYSGSISDYAAYLQNIKNVLSVSLSDIEASQGIQSQYATTGGASVSSLYNVPLSILSKTIWNQCIFIPASADSVNGPFIISGFSKSGDLRRTLADFYAGQGINVYVNPTTNSPVQSYPGVTTINGQDPNNILASINGKHYTCGEIYDAFDKAYTNIVNQEIECVPELKSLDKKTMAILTGSLFTGQAVPKAQTRNIVVQAGLANQVFDAKRNIAIGELPYATGKSIAEFVTSSLGAGYYMAKIIPYIQMGMRAILYAFFPFVFIVVLLPGGLKVLVNYLQTMLWIELWMPTAVILDMFMNFMSSQEFKSMYTDSGMNYLNATQAFSDAAMLAAVAGYLYTSVPALTWLILKGSGYMLGNITSAVGSYMTRNMDSNLIDMDRSQMHALNKVNQDRRLSGLNDISLAEMSKQMSQFSGAQLAGRWEAMRELGEDRMEASSRGMVLKNVSDGIGAGNALSNTNDVEHKAAEVEAKTNIDKKLGEILKNMDNKSRKELIDNIAQGKFAKKYAAESEYVKKMAEAIGADLNTDQGREKVAQAIANGLSYRNATSTLTQDKVSKNISAHEFANTQASKMVLDLEKTKSQLNNTAKLLGIKEDVIDEDGDINEHALKQLKTKFNTLGESQATEIAASIKTIENLGSKNVYEAKLNQMAKKVGLGAAQIEVLKRGLRILSSEAASGKVRKEAVSIMRRLNKGDVSAIYEGAKLLAPVGATKDAWEKIVGDKTVAKLRRVGINSSFMAALNTSKALNEFSNLNHSSDYLFDRKEFANAAIKDLGFGGIVKRDHSRMTKEDRKALSDVSKILRNRFHTDLRHITQDDLMKFAAEDKELQDLIVSHNFKAKSDKEDFTGQEQLVMTGYMQGIAQGTITGVERAASAKALKRLYQDIGQSGVDHTFLSKTVLNYSKAFTVGVIAEGGVVAYDKISGLLKSKFGFGEEETNEAINKLKATYNTDREEAVTKAIEIAALTFGTAKELKQATRIVRNILGIKKKKKKPEGTESKEAEPKATDSTKSKEVEPKAADSTES